MLQIRTYFIILLLLGSVDATFAGTRELRIHIQHRQANRHYEDMAYARAIVHYENARKLGNTSDSLLRCLAHSYLNVSRTDSSEVLYRKLIDGGSARDMDFYYYAQSLRSNQKYKEADRAIKTFRQVRQGDSRGELQYQGAPVIEAIYEKEKYLVEAVDFNTKYSEFGAVVAGSNIYFSSGRRDQSIIRYESSWKGDPYLDIFSIREAYLPTDEPILLSKGINSRFHDGPVCFSPGGGEIFITRNNFSLGLPKLSDGKENHFMLYEAQWQEDSWGELIELPFNSREYSCGHPSITQDGQTLYFSSDMPGGYGGADLYRSTRTDSSWTEPENLGPVINTEGDEMFPFVHTDGSLYFTSNGHLGLGGLDIFYAGSINDGSWKVRNMGYPLNSPADDLSFYLKEDGAEGYFASNRSGGAGEDDIYKFTFLENRIVILTFVGRTINAQSGELLPEAEVMIKAETGETVFAGKSDKEGLVEIAVQAGGSYVVYAAMENFRDTSITFHASNDLIENGEITRDIPLSVIEEWGLFGFIFNKDDGKGEPGVLITITEKDTGAEIMDITDGSGNFSTLLQPETDYELTLKKEGYFTRRGAFTTREMEPGWIDVNDFIRSDLEKITVGKTIEIPNIYYELAKWDIQPEAAVELDKVVRFLMDNQNITIELGSHTDARGSGSSNQELSQKRAESAVNYIVSRGIEKDRITARGYGETMLKNRCADGVSCSEEEHQANRRTEIKIVSL